MECWLFLFFFFNDTATTEIYTLSLHDALPISLTCARPSRGATPWTRSTRPTRRWSAARSWDGRSSCSDMTRSEEHTSELQSLTNLVCRLLLEKKKAIPEK